MPHTYNVTTYLDNLVGALALSVTDVIRQAVADITTPGGELAEAMVLLALRPGVTIKQLAERLRLSHPGAVRLVDRLVARGWAERAPGTDRRSACLSLTEKGSAEVGHVRRARAKRLAELVGILSPEERQILEPILEKMLRRLTSDLVAAYANCRLCDTPVCQRRGCPVEAEARARFAAAT